MSYLIQYVHFSQDVWGMRFSEIKAALLWVRPKFSPKTKDKKKKIRSHKKVQPKYKPLKIKWTKSSFQPKYPSSTRLYSISSVAGLSLLSVERTIVVQVLKSFLSSR